MRKFLAAAICVSGLAIATGANADVTLSGNSDFSGLTYQPNGPGSTAANIAGIITLTNPDNVASFTDTALVLVTNGYLGVSLGTLNTFLAAGAAGDVSFDLLTGTDPKNNLAYWDIDLQNPANLSQTIIWNAFGDNHLGANPFNLAGQDSVNVSCSSAGTCVFNTWSNITATYGTWDVTGVSIGIGSQNDGAQTATIDSITLPGTRTVSDPTGTPEPVTLSLFGAGLLGAAALRSRRKASKS